MPMASDDAVGSIDDLPGSGKGSQVPQRRPRPSTPRENGAYRPTTGQDRAVEPDELQGRGAVLWGEAQCRQIAALPGLEPRPRPDPPLSPGDRPGAEAAITVEHD